MAMKSKLVSSLGSINTPHSIIDFGKKVSEFVRTDSILLKVNGQSDRLTNQQKIPSDHNNSSMTAMQAKKKPVD